MDLFFQGRSHYAIYDTHVNLVNSANGNRDFKVLIERDLMTFGDYALNADASVRSRVDPPLSNPGSDIELSKKVLDECNAEIHSHTTIFSGNMTNIHTITVTGDCRVDFFTSKICEDMKILVSEGARVNLRPMGLYDVAFNKLKQCVETPSTPPWFETSKERKHEVKNLFSTSKEANWDR